MLRGATCRNNRNNRTDAADAPIQRRGDRNAPRPAECSAEQPRRAAERAASTRSWRRRAPESLCTAAAADHAVRRRRRCACCGLRSVRPRGELCETLGNFGKLRNVAEAAGSAPPTVHSSVRRSHLRVRERRMDGRAPQRPRQFGECRTLGNFGTVRKLWDGAEASRALPKARSPSPDLEVSYVTVGPSGSFLRDGGAVRAGSASKVPHPIRLARCARRGVPRRQSTAHICPRSSTSAPGPPHLRRDFRIGTDVHIQDRRIAARWRQRVRAGVCMRVWG